VSELPTKFQKTVCWSALTTLGVVALVASLVLAVYVVSSVVAFLQPVLLPFAVAAVLAYLLEPVVAFFCRRGASRTVGTLIVFLLFSILTAGILVSVIPTAWRQGGQLIQDFPTYSKKAQELGMRTLQSLEKLQRPPVGNGEKEEGAEEAEEATSDFLTGSAAELLQEGMDWLRAKLPDLALAAGNFLQRSLGGFLGAFGLILGFVLIPVFLFYLLRDAPAIAERWADFLPLKSSPLKSEIVSLLSEINGYIIAFFRGQILVALIDGAIIAAVLLFMGMEFALLIGFLVATLGIIPYAGTILTWGPAVLIAAAQYGDWTHPLLVTLLFVVVNQFDSLFLTPWIIGDSVGLHPLTVMIAVLLWTVILGGLIGAILAVPITAALKVLARRYLWDRSSRSAGNQLSDAPANGPPAPAGA